MTNFWWVNQNNSYDHDRQLGILWAPLRNSRGHIERSWEDMDKVQPGDVVFHYAGQHVKAVSCVSRSSVPTTNPYKNTDAWRQDGRSVQTVYADLDPSLPLDQIPLEQRLSDTLVGKAFTKHGIPKEGYLFRLSSDVGLWLSERLDLIAEDATSETDETASTYAASAYYDQTNRQVVVNARREQSMLRDFLFKGKSESECAICGKTLPVQLLTTAHIKKRSQCNTSEQNDPNVVMPACNLGCDSLFEKHYIVIDEHGIIRHGLRQGTPDMSPILNQIVGRKCTALTGQTDAYFAWHRAESAGLHGMEE
jgi:hypothetical protein